MEIRNCDGSEIRNASLIGHNLFLLKTCSGFESGSSAWLPFGNGFSGIGIVLLVLLSQ